MPLYFWVIEAGPCAFTISWVLARGGQQWQLVLALACASLLSLGGLAAQRSRIASTAATAIALVGLLASVAPAILTRPLLGLILLFVSIALVARVGNPGVLTDLLGRRESQLRADVADIRWSASIAIFTWLIGIALQRELDPWLVATSAIVSLLAGTRALIWGRTALHGRVRFVWVVVSACFVLLAIGAGLRGMTSLALVALVLLPATALVVARIGGAIIVDTSWTSLVLGHPARLVVATFLLLCGVGFALLSLPIAVEGDVVISNLDAAFTAVSAVCVTGLITVDTQHTWTTTGHVILLILIQVGGLGIMTLSTAAFGLLGRRLSVRHEEAMASLFSNTHRGHLFVALRRTLLVTFAVEAAGALLLTTLFWMRGDAVAQAAWRGVFTAISAFCNAGFALQTESLIPYQDSPAVLHVIALLIIAGGLSPAVVVVVPRWFRREPISPQAKIVLLASTGLLLLGFFAFAAIEWSNSLADLSILDRLHNAWFQSATLRTAGFNSVNLAELQSATLVLSLLLMFVGGASGGTAGGIKVTTAWVLAVTVVASMRGERNVSSFGRRIGQDIVYRSVAITAIGFFAIVVILCAVLLTQDMDPALALFETFSAFGTVGLTIGGTGGLDGLGRVLLMIAMFLGRIGPLTAFLLLVERQHRHGSNMLETNIEVG